MNHKIECNFAKLGNEYFYNGYSFIILTQLLEEIVVCHYFLKFHVFIHCQKFNFSVTFV